MWHLQESDQIGRRQSVRYFNLFVIENNSILDFNPLWFATTGILLFNAKTIEIINFLLAHA